ncbi:AraC-like DNA-binding protein [Nonomuraea thailandensis]|uniref:AraC-like DNA-binding protein n=1 Tax=Nonomuraea thailandensis TaxID=1188745 RepID=A0A9X2K1X8_9ACTN|nr:AraC family transcriptional regulator [Nonomuraea thailandensis]MCP2357772.1 AraC-like DNA-binding protein [Nonomuraea thailandensis]
MDPLADLLDGVRARSADFCRAILEPPWSLRIADGAMLALATALRGHAWIVPDEGEPVLMRTGDVAIIKGPAPYTIGDDPATEPDTIVHPGNRLTTMDGVDVTDALRIGPRTSGQSPDGSAIVASGTYQVSGDVTGRLLNALPHILVVPRPSTQAPIMDLLAQELSGEGPGQRVFLDRLLDLALIATLRAWFARPEARAPGWYRAQSDPLIGPALRLIHDDPARPWTVAALAAKVGASRAAFARRFATLVGEPPMAYLTGWRIALAADLLRSSETTIDAIARHVGYANAFALSVAFKRVRGVSPSHHRAGV